MNNYGILINKDITLHRMWFNEMVELLGIYCNYYIPNNNKYFDRRGDLKTNYTKFDKKIGVIFDEHPDQKSLKKMGWITELQENSSIIHVPYDLINIQKGCLFEIPGGLDNTKPRLFRVLNISNIMIYPASLSCEIAPEYLDIDEQSIHTDFKNKNISLLIDNEEDD